MTKMNTNFKNLEYRIIKANASEAYEKVKKVMETINGNALVVGTGGSFATAEFISKSLPCFSVAIKPREIFFQRVEDVDYVIFVTYSGKTYEIIEGINYCIKVPNIKKIIIIVWNAEKLREQIEDNEKIEIIEYKKDDKKEKSFISLASTLAPASMFARYYCEVNNQEFESYLKYILADAKKAFKKTKKGNYFNNLCKKPYIEVIYESESKSAAVLLESNLTETGMVFANFHEKKDYSHGRYMLNYSQNTPITIWLKSSHESQYDMKLQKYFNDPGQNNNLLIIKSCYKGILGDFELMVKCMYLTKYIAEQVNIDISRMNYSKDAVRLLYKFKGELI